MVDSRWDAVADARGRWFESNLRRTDALHKINAQVYAVRACRVPGHVATRPDGAGSPPAKAGARMTDDENTVMLSWPVGAVAGELGLSASTLRSWERRYGLGPTRRTGGNHRRYGPGDVLRVRLMARLTAQGVPARTAADAIADMDDGMVAVRLSGPPAEPPTADARTAGVGGHAVDEADIARLVVDHVVAAAHALDAVSLVHLYRSTLRRYELVDAWTNVLSPVLRRIGDEWAAGRLGVESEHLASELLQAELRAVVRAQRVVATGPPVLLTAAEDEQHHLPLVALEAELGRRGVPAIHLGPRVPARSTVAAMTRARARAVFVWASLDREADEPFWTLLAAAEGGRGRVVLGGPGWPDGVEARHTPIDVCRVEDLSSAVAALVAPGPTG